MGWLEERVKKAKGTSKVSWRAVAREIQGAPASKGLGINKESLATYLGAFDSGKSFHLLIKHPRLRTLLVDYLQVSEEEFDEQLQVLGEPRESQPRYVIWDASTRPIDLRQESLPQAFPPEVLDPRAWVGRPVLWKAPNGSGRTLVGEWHRAQGKVVFIEAESWAEAQRKLPTTGRVFIELKSPLGLPSVASLPVGRDVCVAVDGVPDAQARSRFQAQLEDEPEDEPENEHSSGSDWAVVESPPVDQWLKELVFWLEERRVASEGFDPEACLEWLRKDILPLGLIDGFETAVGFVGMYAEHGKRIERGTAGRSTSLMDLARYFLRMRIHRIPEQDARPDFRDLLALLLQMARHLLVHGEQPWFQARSIEEWRAIVRTGPDSSEIGQWLSDPTTQDLLKVSSRDVQKALAARPPEALQRVRTLQQLFLLRERQPGLYVLRPSWVFVAMLQEAAESLLEESAEIWGEALLHAHGADVVVRKLVTRCQDGDFKPIRRLLAKRDLKSPAWVAALESSFVALGWTRINHEEVPEDLIMEVFDLQQQLTFEVNGIPLPRTLPPQGLQSSLLKPGSWLLAAHALAEKRGALRRVAHPVLDPWSGGEPTEFQTRALRQIWADLFEQPQKKEIRIKILELYGRLFHRVGLFGSAGAMFQFPEAILEHFRTGALSMVDIKALGSRKALVPLLRPYVEARGHSWADFARALWQAWLDSGEALPAVMVPGRRPGNLWPFIPARAILDARLGVWLSGSEVPYDSFTEEQWTAFLAFWPARVRTLVFDIDPARPWRFMPEAVIRRALTDEVLGSEDRDDEARRIIWKKAPGMVREGLREALKQGRWVAALGLARTSPAEEAQGLIAIFREASGLPESLRGGLMHWLHELVLMRVPGWRDAWALRGLLEEKSSVA